jgi:mannitol/fructose-specific phosphotransferase system IIA component (Ntr-type)
VTPDPATTEFGYPAVDVPPSAATPEAVVRFLVGELAMTCGVAAEQIDDVVRRVMQRETLGTTGIGGGVALPHTRSDAILDRGILVGRLAAPMDWHAIDGEPVRFVCLLLAPPAQPGEYLRAMETLVRNIRDRRG